MRCGGDGIYVSNQLLYSFLRECFGGRGDLVERSLLNYVPVSLKRWRPTLFSDEDDASARDAAGQLMSILFTLHFSAATYQQVAMEKNRREQ